MIDLEELKKRALAATPGPWKFAVGSANDPMPVFKWVCGAWSVEDRTLYAVAGPHADTQSRNDAKYVIAANPAVVLKLIAEHQELGMQFIAAVV